MSEDIFNGQTTDYSEEDAFLESKKTDIKETIDSKPDLPSDISIEKPIEEAPEPIVKSEQSFEPVDKVEATAPSPVIEEQKIASPVEPIRSKPVESVKPLRDVYGPDTVKQFAEEKVYAEEDALINKDEKPKAFFGDSTWATIKDVGIQLYKGVGTGALETLEAVDWVATNARKLDPIAIGINWLTGQEAQPDVLGQKSAEAVQQLQKNYAQSLPQAETGVGELSQSASQFITGFIAGGQFTKGIKAIQASPTIINSMTRGALAEFLAFDQNTKNLSDFIESNPSLRNPITEYLSHDGDESVFEGRLKNALEGVLVGSVVEGVTNGIKILRKLAPRGWTPEGVPATLVDEAGPLSKNLTGSAKTNFDSQIAELAAKEKSGYEITRDVLLHTYTSNLLALKSHATNIISNTIATAGSIGETAIARGVSKLSEATGGSILKHQRGLEAGEISAQISGMLRGTSTAIDLAAEAFKTGKSTFGGTKLEMTPSLGAKTFNLEDTSVLGMGVEALGKITNLTGKALQAEDEFAKVIHASGAMQQLATRQAVREGLSGDKLVKRIDAILKSPSDDIIKQAEQVARINTFTNDLGKYASTLSKIREDIPISKFVVPFYNTLANITKYGLERFPPSTFLFKQNREAWARGGVDQAQTIAKFGMGSVYTSAIAGLYYSGNATGKIDFTDATAKAAGQQEYSFKLGDTWVNYSKYAPVGQVMRLAIDSFDVVNHLVHPEDDETRSQVILNLVSTIGEALTDGTWAESASELLSTIQNPNKVQKFIQDKAKSIAIPATISDVAKLIDPHVREAQSFVDKLKASIPGLSQELPIRYDVFGRPLQAGGVPGFFGVKRTAETPDTFDDVLVEADIDVPLPKYTQSFDGVDMNLRDYPEVFSEMMKLTGEIKHPEYFGKTLSQTLEKVTSGEGYLGRKFKKASDGADGGKTDIIRDIVNDYRAEARNKIYRTNDEFRMAVKLERDTRKAKKLIHDQLLGE